MRTPFLLPLTFWHMVCGNHSLATSRAPVSPLIALLFHFNSIRGLACHFPRVLSSVFGPLICSVFCKSFKGEDEALPKWPSPHLQSLTRLLLETGHLSNDLQRAHNELSLCDRFRSKDLGTLAYNMPEFDILISELKWTFYSSFLYVQFELILRATLQEQILSGHQVIIVEQYCSTSLILGALLHPINRTTYNDKPSKGRHLVWILHDV